MIVVLLLLLSTTACVSQAERERETAETERREQEQQQMFAEEQARVDGIKQREIEHQSAEIERKRAEKDRRDQNAMKLAKQHGFKHVLLNEPLPALLESAIDDAIPIATLRQIAVQQHWHDSYFIASQILSPHEALFYDESRDVRIFVKTHGATVYEGTPLSALGAAFWRIVGVKSYSTVLGAPAQAFIIEKAW
ncbi:MAG: hypothetical protein AABY95_12055 [Pseudomonadota bacterium]